MEFANAGMVRDGEDTRSGAQDAEAQQDLGLQKPAGLFVMLRSVFECKFLSVSLHHVAKLVTKKSLK